MGPTPFSCICSVLLFVLISSASAKSIAVDKDELQGDFVGELKTEEENENLLEALALIQRTFCRYLSQCKKFLRSDRNLHAVGDYRRPQIEKNYRYTGDAGSPQMERNVYDLDRYDAGDEYRPQMERNVRYADDSGSPQMERGVRYADDSGSPQMERAVYEARRRVSVDRNSPQIEKKPFLDPGDRNSPQIEKKNHNPEDRLRPQMERTVYDARFLDPGDRNSPQIERNVAASIPSDAGEPQKQSVRSDEMSADEIVEYLIELAREKKQRV